MFRRLFHVYLLRFLFQTYCCVLFIQPVKCLLWTQLCFFESGVLVAYDFVSTACFYVRLRTLSLRVPVKSVSMVICYRQTAQCDVLSSLPSYCYVKYPQGVCWLYTPCGYLSSTFSNFIFSANTSSWLKNVSCRDGGQSNIRVWLCHIWFQGRMR